MTHSWNRDFVYQLPLGSSYTRYAEVFFSWKLILQAESLCAQRIVTDFLEYYVIGNFGT